MYLIVSVLVTYILNFIVFGLFLVIVYTATILLLYFYSNFSREVYSANINSRKNISLFLILLGFLIFKNNFIKKFSSSISINGDDLLNKYIFFHRGLFMYNLFHSYFWYLILFIILLLVFIFLVIEIVGKNRHSS